jgi:hypothetical protein
MGTVGTFSLFNHLHRFICMHNCKRKQRYAKGFISIDGEAEENNKKSLRQRKVLAHVMEKFCSFLSNFDSSRVKWEFSVDFDDECLSCTSRWFRELP